MKSIIIGPLLLYYNIGKIVEIYNGKVEDAMAVETDCIISTDAPVC